jgi:hypothetical protein
MVMSSVFMENSAKVLSYQAGCTGEILLRIECRQMARAEDTERKTD